MENLPLGRAMSRSTIERTFHCSNDCRQQGCPGHTMSLEYHHTSDTVTVSVDGQHRVTFDKTEWRTLVNMDEELRTRP